jgi:hypothetical protein
MEKKATLRKIPEGSRPPIVRLSSSAVYHRPAVSEGSITTPGALSSTYQQTLSIPAADPAAMTARCIAVRAEVSRARMVRAAAATIDPARLDALRAEADAVTEERRAEQLATKRLAETQALRNAQPHRSAAVQELSETLSKEPRHTQEHVMLKTFFSQGGGEGPFPGSVSELGMVMAGAYWVDAARAGNTKFDLGKLPGRFGPDGRRLLNHNLMP